MLQRIKLTNFKCFEKLDLNCAPLTLLCGLNGMGKSSVLQSLLVLRQSSDEGQLSGNRLILNHELAALGTGKDVLYEGATADMLTFELHHENLAPYILTADYSPESDQLKAMEKSTSAQWSETPPFGGRLWYINAERIGPRKIYDRSETLARRGELGAHGEYALNYLATHRDVALPKGDLRCSELSSRGLYSVLDHWLQQVTPGAHLNFDSIPNANALLSGFVFDQPGDAQSNRYLATNVGFGLSYVLPVLVALLAPEDTLCLIENPEAHIHPQGQTKLAELAVRAALSGAQIIVETHSDHFMDGVRIAVREGLLEPQQVVFHYFERVDGKTIVSSPEINADGRLSSWPSGFFNQHEENLAKLLAPKS